MASGGRATDGDPAAVREALISALGGYQSLAASDHAERPVDRLGALAYAQLCADGTVGGDAKSFLASLGVDLICVKFANLASSREPAALKLAVVLNWRANRLKLSAAKLETVARWAIGEWVNSACLTCKGAKAMPVELGVEGAQPMMECPTCHGSGLMRWTDEERLQALGGDFNKPIELAHQYIGAAVSEAERGAALMLERWTRGGD